MRRATVLLLKLFFVPGILLTGHNSYSQYFKENQIPVMKDGKALLNPFSGGINSVMVNMMDVTGDGKEDLVLFERTLGKAKVFEAEGENWIFRPELSFYFDVAESWMLLRDFDGDGDKDLFTAHPVGIRLFVNESAAGELPVWRPFNSGEGILSTTDEGAINIPLSVDDVPSIEDIDGDGRLDILNFALFSGNIEYHRNMAASSDTLVFTKESDRWGDFEECQCGFYAFGNSCSDVGGRIEHNASRAILAFDMDGDGDKDLALGEEDCNQIILLENTGTNQDAVIRNPTASLPGESRPLQLFTYPVPYFEDIDHDGDKDFIFSSHVRFNIGVFMNFRFNLILHENIGSAAQPQFSFVMRNYLQDEMIDVGENAYPVFIDMDNDGDKEMIVGRNTDNIFSGRTSSLYLYENTGTPTDPSFTLFTEDYLFLSIWNHFNIRPQVADINGDKNTDLIYTANTNSEATGYVYYVLNPSFWNFSIGVSQVTKTDITVQLGESTHFIDADDDGDLDMFIGRASGRLEFYRNDGGLSAETMTLIDNNFIARPAPLFGGIPQVEVVDLDQDGGRDMIIAWGSGTIWLVKDVFEEGAFDTEPEIPQFRVGDQAIATARTWGNGLHVTAVNLFNEDIPALAMGTAQGGLVFFRHEEAEQFAYSGNLDITPSLVTGENEFLKLDASRNAILEFYTASGQLFHGPVKVSNTEDFRLITSGFASGMYIVRIYYNDGQFVSRKFVIVK